MPVERVPLYDILEMMAYGKQKGARLLGPGSIGIISPGIAAAGWLGGLLTLRKGYLSPDTSGDFQERGAICHGSYTLKKQVLGMSTVVHVGTEPVVGQSFADILPLFQADDETHAVPSSVRSAERTRKRQQSGEA